MDSAVADEREETERPAPWGRVGTVSIIAALVILIDQASKHWAVTNLQNGRVVDVVGDLHFALTWNTGASFSLGEGRNLGPFIAVLALGIVVWLLRSGHSRTVLGATAAGLVAGGAVGNLIDRAFRSGPAGAEAGFMGGAVVDFIALPWWPTFNVADSGVVVGAILLVLATWREGEADA